MKTTTFSILLATFLLLRNQSAAGGGDESAASSRLSLSEVTSAVLANNPAIKEALNKWNAARARVPQAGSWDDARLGGDSRVHRFVDVPPNAFTDQSVSIEQVVPITGKNLLRARAAVAEAISAYEDVRRQQLDTIAAARASFFRLANAYEQLEINRKNIDSLKQIADISRAKYEAGTQSAADVLVAETDESKLEEAQRDLERQLSDEQSLLNTLMNRDAFAPLSVAATASVQMPELSPSRLRPLLLTHRPEIKMAEAKIDREKWNLQLAHREWIPDPALMVKAERYNDAGQAVSEVDAGVSFPLPWINFRKYAAGVREAGENVGAAEQALNLSKNEALRLLRDQLEKIETFHHHVELFRDKLVPQAQQAFEANRLAYESGKASFLDWITAQRVRREVEATARMHLADYQVAVAGLEAIIGAQLYPLPADPPEPKAKRK
jgi:outer membrane protein TolC